MDKIIARILVRQYTYFDSVEEIGRRLDRAENVE